MGTPPQTIDLRRSFTRRPRSPLPSRPPPPLPALCLPVTMRATRPDCGPPRAPSMRPREKEGNARGPACRDGEHNVTRTSTTTATPARASPKAHRPTSSSRRSTRRRRKSITGRGGIYTLNIASLAGAPPADLLALDRAPPPTLDLSALDRAPSSELRRPAHPCRPLGLIV